MVIGRNNKGFTLLEILIVIAIIGIMMGVVLLSTNFLSHWHNDEIFGKKIEQLIIFSQEVATSRQQEVGMKLERGKLLFFAKSNDFAEWLPLEDVPLLKPVPIPAHLKVKLQVVGIFNRENAQDPDVVLTPTGEMTPFVLYITQGDASFVIQGSYNGTVQTISKQ